MKISRAKDAPVAAARAHGAHGIPEHVHPEGQRQPRSQPPDQPGHGRGRGGIDGEFVGPVVLVAEHDRVETRGLERIEIARRVLEKPFEPALCVMERCAGQRAEMHHGDHRPGLAEHRPKSRRHAVTPLAVQV